VNPDGGGYYTIENNSSGLCLQPSDASAPTVGMRIQQQQCDRSRAQEWVLTNYGPSSGPEYMISARLAPGFAMTAEQWGNPDWTYNVLDRPYAAASRLWMFYPE
jgi:hypothetical protein